VDSDGDEHRVGEEWTFVGTLFSKFDDELTICIRRDSGEEWMIPLIWKKGMQQEVIERWQEYLMRT